MDTTAFGGILKSFFSRLRGRPFATRRPPSAREGPTFVVVYAENSDVVATYSSFGEALRDLAEFVGNDPGLQDDIGLRIYEHGRPVGRWIPASLLVGAAQAHLGEESRWEAVEPTR
jgi:hypothetical protein